MFTVLAEVFSSNKHSLKFRQCGILFAEKKYAEKKIQ